MTTYKLTINLDATLAVHNENGSFNYFKPSIGAEITTNETDDMKILNQKFEDLYAEVIGPNFNSVVKEFLINAEDEEKSEEQLENNNNCCGGTSDACDCKKLEIGLKPEASTETCSVCGQPDNCGDCNHEPLTSEESEQLSSSGEALPKEEWE